jgi:hypothetical protein
MNQSSPLKMLMSILNKKKMDQHSKKKVKIMRSSGLDLTTKQRKMIYDFVNFVYDSLNLTGDYKCYLSANRKSAGIKTTAVCAYSEKRISVYCKERALADILRSIAHEMFHLRQNELDIVPHDMPPHHLNPIEWEANIAAGSMLSYFAQMVGRNQVYE